MGYPRIQYNSINVDFDRHFNEFSPPEEIAIVGQNESGAGIVQTQYYYSREILSAKKNNLKPNLVAQLRQWFAYVKTGQSFKLWFDRSFGMFLDFEGESLDTTDELSPTFARSGVANRTNPHTGLIKEIAASTPRYEAGKYGNGLLIEGAVTNLITQPEDLSHSDWTKSNVSISANTTEILDPEGENKADKLTASANDGTCTYTTSTAITTTSGCFSIYLAAQEPATVTLLLKNSTGTTLATQACSVGIEMQRFFVRYVSQGTKTGNWRVVILLDASGDIVYAFGAQLEVGASVSFPTSYINGSRSAETLYYDITSGTQINQLTGTIALWFKPVWNHYELPDGNAPYRYFFQVVNSAGATCFECYRDEYQQIYFKAYAPDGSTTIGISRAIETFLQNDWNHLVIVYDFTTQGGIKIYLNGIYLDQTIELDDAGIPALDDYGWVQIIEAHNSSRIMLPRIPDKIYIGSDDTPANHLNAVIDDVFIYKEALDINWVRRTYNQQSLGWMKNYWSALMLADFTFNPILKVGGNRYDFNLKAKEVIT